ncbi:MAG: hypothetical protein EXR71_14955 [Myxococcales bacterium]|nr:hypothetical protein [Myxococcales bacterium]
MARELRRFVQAVEGAEPATPFAVVGGLAVSVHTEPRFTRDVDVAVGAASDAEAEALVRHLQRAGYRILAVLEHAAGRMSTVRLIPPGGSEDGVVVDLLFASSGVEAELIAAAQLIEVLPGVKLPMARIGDLMALKLLSVDAKRPNDAQDLLALAAAASPGEITRCRNALSLITQRGYHRGRDLARALDALLAENSLSS